MKKRERKKVKGSESDIAAPFKQLCSSTELAYKKVFASGQLAFANVRLQPVPVMEQNEKPA